MARGSGEGQNDGQKPDPPIAARNRWKARITSAPAEAGSYGGIYLRSSTNVTIDGFEILKMPRAGVAVVSDGPDVTGADTRGNIVRNCWSHDNGANQGMGASDGVFTGYALDVLIEGNLIENNAEHGIYVSNSADNPIVRNNIVRGNFAQGIQINADGDLPGDGVITNWEISGNELSGNSLRGGSTAINLDGAVGGRAFNNLLHGNGKAGFVLWRGNGKSGSSANVFFNNTVYHPAGTKAAFLLYTDAADNVIFNNILYSRAGGLNAEESGAGNQHDHNLLASVVESEAGPNEAMPDALTLFVDAPGGNFNLRPGSAAVDRGVASFAGKPASTSDRQGRARPAGAALDIGCYEQDGAGPTDGGAIPDAGGGDGPGPGPTPGTGGSGGAGGSDGGARDGAAPASDAGPGAGGGSDGCGCRVGAGQPGGVPAGWVAAALAAAALLWRRRRHLRPGLLPHQPRRSPQPPRDNHM